MTESSAVPPPYVDRDCHRGTRNYVVQTKLRGEPWHHHAVFVNDSSAAFGEAAALADERILGLFRRRFEGVRLWEGAGHDRLLCTWTIGKPEFARSIPA